MKNIICLILICFLSKTALADCDWTQIKKNTDNTYTYTENLHICVGHLVQSNKTLTAQNEDLTKAIQLKDLALTKSDERVQLWMDTSNKLEDRVTKIDQLYKSNEFMYFTGGVLSAVLVGFATAKLIGH